MSTPTIDVTIYGASDDLVEFKSTDRSIHGEAYLSGIGDSTVRLIAPDGQTLTIVVGFCTFTDGWGIRVDVDAATPEWPVLPGRRPYRDDDPAVTVTVPAGTRATCDGEDVR